MLPFWKAVSMETALIWGRLSLGEDVSYIIGLFYYFFLTSLNSQAKSPPKRYPAPATMKPASIIFRVMSWKTNQLMYTPA